MIFLLGHSNHHLLAAHVPVGVIEFGVDVDPSDLSEAVFVFLGGIHEQVLKVFVYLDKSGTRSVACWRGLASPLSKNKIYSLFGSDP